MFDPLAIINSLVVFSSNDGAKFLCPSLEMFFSPRAILEKTLLYIIDFSRFFFSMGGNSANSHIQKVLCAWRLFCGTTRAVMSPHICRAIEPDFYGINKLLDRERAVTTICVRYHFYFQIVFSDDDDAETKRWATRGKETKKNWDRLR